MHYICCNTLCINNTIILLKRYIFLQRRSLEYLPCNICGNLFFTFYINIQIASSIYFDKYYLVTRFKILTFSTRYMLFLILHHCSVYLENKGIWSSVLHASALFDGGAFSKLSSLFSTKEQPKNSFGSSLDYGIIS